MTIGGENGLDAMGGLIFNVMGAFAQFERDLISDRTKQALQAKIQQGIKLGKPCTISEETKEKIREARKYQKNTNKGTKWSEESRKRMSQSVTGRKHTNETKQKQSKALIGIAKPKLKCPHCGKEGGAPQMKQWHFDNCINRK